MPKQTGIEQASVGRSSGGAVRAGGPRRLTRRQNSRLSMEATGDRRRRASEAYRATLDALGLATMVPEDERCFLTVQKVGVGFLVTARFPHAELMKVVSQGAGYVQYALHTGAGLAHLSFSVAAAELEPGDLQAFKAVAR